VDAAGAALIPQDQFVAARQRDWHELDALLGVGDPLHNKDGSTISRAASLYRSLCHDLVRCRTARYSPDLASYLDGLAGRAHAVLYATRPLRLPGAVRMVLVDFPVALRKNSRFFWLAFALFFIPWMVGMFATLASKDFAYEVLPASMLEGMADAYGEGFDKGRAAGTNTGMAGFYVYNNVGIAFRCFATGILFGLGSLFFLVYNGLVIGTMVGFVMQAGAGENIWTFMCGHGPFELTAIVISGAAGLQMGYALVETKGLTRVGSLRKQASDITAQVVGAAVMLVIAAAIEGFWSPSGLPREVKWGASAFFSLLVIGFLVFAGRKSAPRSAAA
jgi:uncharacterized membrane protein SpoIIM required for sporulation